MRTKDEKVHDGRVDDHQPHPLLNTSMNDPSFSLSLLLYLKGIPSAEQGPRNILSRHQKMPYVARFFSLCLSSFLFLFFFFFFLGHFGLFSFLLIERSICRLVESQLAD